MRALLLAICLLGCKKHEPQEAAPAPPAEPSRGHSFTPFKDGGAGGPSSGDEVAAASSDDAAATADARLYGGDGSPAYRDAQGHVHGPGGPVFMGHGVPCDASRDHCLREGVWFSASDARPGAMYRALPAFKLEDKWFDWRGNEIENPGKLFKTQLGTLDTITAGSPVVFLSPETPSNPWEESEYDALTTSRWEITYVESVNRSAKTFRVKGWPDDLPLDVARAVTEQQTAH